MASCATTSFSYDSNTLEVTIISAEDLRQGRHCVGRGAFVTVRSGQSVASTASGTDDTHGYPLWNERLHINAPPHGGWIQVDVAKRRHGDATNSVHIAGAKVPMSDFSYGPIGYKHFLSYRLRDQEGRSNGIVNLCVKRLVGNGEGQFNEQKYTMGYPVGPVAVGYSAYHKY
ncbi:hypothetical protein LUZ61_019839 [Rhynchospora tenuis]|uniref:C2 domain-containing protein n=1 Tax=Rhynchospora tenuis TaxID=198213 RepID=A0AAD6EN69_9POAL|nr:hypothetical protein LUZ61_019839 [Rhynchospora tenuis]